MDWSAAEFQENSIDIGGGSEVLIAAQLGKSQRLYCTMNDKNSMWMPQHEKDYLIDKASSSWQP